MIPSPASCRNKTAGFSSRVQRNLRPTLFSSLLFTLSLWAAAASFSAVFAQVPTVTVRFANPSYDCGTQLYTVDVEMKSSLANTEVFGMNIRFFFDDAVLQFHSYSGWQGGYGAASPNPPGISTSGPFGANLGFVGGASYFNGGMEKVNSGAPPIYLSTSGWTKLYSVRFTVDAGFPSNANFCAPLVWDLEQNPANGGYFNDGVVITVYTSGGNTGPSTENCNQFNWAYTGNGTPPYGAPVQQHCIDITCGGGCELTVNTTADSGAGSLRDVIGCAPAGSTIIFASSVAGQTINLTSGKIVINKTLNIHNNNSSRVSVTTTQPYVFEISAGKSVHFKYMNVSSGISDVNNNGAAYQNYGILKLENMNIFRNASLPAGRYVIRNYSGSQLQLVGTNNVEY